MTEGKPLSLMIRFSSPLFLANVLQVLYILADSAIVGRILGVSAFASIGTAVILYWFVTRAVTGLVHGFGVIVAQRFGAGVHSRNPARPLCNLFCILTHSKSSVRNLQHI